MSVSSRKFSRLAFSALLLSALLPAVARADEDDEKGPDKKEGEKDSRFEVSGYGELTAIHSDYSPNPRAGQRGSKHDSRTDFDTRRFSLELEGKLDRGFNFKAELEVEHGGTGSSIELEYEEGGEYENEVEKGGEVVFENLYLEKAFGDHAFRIGKFPVAVGLLPGHHEPLDYLSAVRAESESHIIPDAWSEMGIDYRWRTEKNTLALQLINGLDSSGFSSQEFIVGGYQNRFDGVKATDPAFVARWSTRYIPGLDTGFAIYHGETSRNRPEADLAKKCTGSSTSTNNSLAPCDYTKAPVTLISWHAMGVWDNLRAQASVIQGQIKNAQDVNRVNSTLPVKFIGVHRSAVAERAYSAWAEVGYAFEGYDALDKVIPFFRYDQYDTVDKTAAGQLDNQRYMRRIWAIGADYQFAKSVILKLDTARRTYGSKDLRVENEVRFNTSFLF